MSEEGSARLGKLILIPAAITLAVTLLRLVGELQRWSPTLFSREPGGGGSLVGISWLVPVFGAWFGWALVRAGKVPASFGRAALFVLLAIAVVPAVGFGAAALGFPERSFTTFGFYVAASVVGLIVALRAWPALGRTLLAYAFAARIPVVIVMLIAMLGNWGTHYDVPPDAQFPAMSPLAKWFTIGLVPQMSIWLWFTVALGGLFGLGAAAIARRRAPVPAGRPQAT